MTIEVELDGLEKVAELSNEEEQVDERSSSHLGFLSFWRRRNIWYGGCRIMILVSLSCEMFEGKHLSYSLE